MIECKPKKSTYFSLSLVLLILLSGLIYILRDFAYTRTYGLVFYLISASLVTLVILMLLVKMMVGYKFITAGKDRIITRLPLHGKTKSYSLNQVMAWEEDKVMANKKEFRQLTIVFDDKTSFAISNHEHVNYSDFLEYFQKRLAKKKIQKKA